MSDAPTLAKGYISPEMVAERYQATSGRDLSNLPFYVAFNLAFGSDHEGVRVRFTSGAMGNKDIGDEMEGFNSRIDALLEASTRN